MDWIKCSERLPENGERVLVVYMGHVWTAKLDNTDWWLPTGVPRKDDVTHWMPLPEVPAPTGEGPTPNPSRP